MKSHARKIWTWLGKGNLKRKTESLLVVAPERVTNENANTDIRLQIIFTRKIELHRKGKKSPTVWITPIFICLFGSEISQH